MLSKTDFLTLNPLPTGVWINANSLTRHMQIFESSGLPQILLLFMLFFFCMVKVMNSTWRELFSPQFCPYPCWYNLFFNHYDYLLILILLIVLSNLNFLLGVDIKSSLNFVDPFPWHIILKFNYDFSILYSVDNYLH